ncbi:MAG: hypothetical protein EB078_01440 [Proteobacteria bacterium]|nr:hypothetical protein [Pseudomonadota bacterium]
MQVQADLTQAREQVANLTKQIAEAGSGVASVKVDTERVDALTFKLERATKVLNDLKQDAGRASSVASLEAIREELDGLLSKRVQLENKAIRIQGDERNLQKVNREIDEITAKIDKLEGRKAKIELRAEGYSQELEQAQARVEKLTRLLEKAKAAGSEIIDVGELQQQLATAEKDVTRLERAFGKTVSQNFGAGVNLEQLDAVAERGQRAGDILGKLPGIMDAVGKADLESASAKMRQLVSQSEALTKPINKAVQLFGSLSTEVQAGFLPVLVDAQSKIERLNEAIESGEAPAEAIRRSFAEVKSVVDKAVVSVQQLAEASGKVGRLKTGAELAFAQPGLSAALDRGARVGEQAAALPAATIQANPRIVELLAQINQLGNQATEAYARLQAKVAAGLPTGSAQRSLDSLVQKLETASEEAERLGTAEKRAADNEIALLQRREQAAKAAEIAAQAAAQKAADNEIALLQRREQAAKAAETERLAAAQKAADNEIALLQRREQAAKAAEIAAQAAAHGNGVAGRLGLDVEAPGRQLSVLESEVVGIKNQLDTLPESLRSRFTPAIREAENELIRLSGAPAALPNEIEAARQRLIHLSQDASRAGQALRFSQNLGGAGTTGIELGLDELAVSGYTAQLRVLQQAIVGVAVDARGPAVEAINRLRNAIAGFLSEGSISTGPARAAIRQLTQEAVAASAAASGIDPRALNRRVGRAGDIGRGGFDRFQLAVQQAGFALDDFFSVTGGIDQKIRAVSNNISQLGFIIGSTTGLFVALGVTISAQIGLALYKFVNDGRTAADQTKVLNDALEKQKTIAEEVAQAFRSLGDSLTKGVFSKSAEDIRSFQKELDLVLKKRKEASRAAVVDLDPTVQLERATQSAINKQIENETDPGRRAALVAKRRESERREKEAAEAAGAAPAPTDEEVRRGLRRGVFVSGRYGPSAADRARFAEIDRQVAQVSGSPQAAIDLLRKEQDRLRETALQNPFNQVNAEKAAQAIAELERLIQRLQNSLNEADSKVIEEILKSGKKINIALVEVQELLDESVAPFSGIREQAEKTADELRKVVEEIEKGGLTSARLAELNAQKAALEQQAFAARAAAQALRLFADTLNRISTNLVNQVAEEARSNADSARRAANEAAGVADVNGEFGPNGERRRPGDAQRDAQRAEDEAAAAADDARRTQDEARPKNSR